LVGLAVVSNLTLVTVLPPGRDVAEAEVSDADENLPSFPLAETRNVYFVPSFRPPTVTRMVKFHLRILLDYLKTG
jgi:hypothetical protein